MSASFAIGQLEMFADGDGHAAPAGAKFRIDGLQVEFHGRFRKAEIVSHFLVAAAFGEKFQNGGG